MGGLAFLADVEVVAPGRPLAVREHKRAALRLAAGVSEVNPLDRSARRIRDVVEPAQLLPLTMGSHVLLVD
jgi:hypothetical protein